MKYSKLSMEKILGVRATVRHKVGRHSSQEQQFAEPIIHREIHGDKVYVPLNLYRVWNEA